VRPVERQQAAQMVSLARRQMLHAAGLSLQHPRLGTSLTFTAPLPDDMARVLEGLRGGAKPKIG
jgi:23S rRNA pseudouridine1911/1915/1917 synthase